MANDDSRGEVEEQLKSLGYIDPGAGSSMWQGGLAGFLRTWTRITSVFGAKAPEEED